MPRTSLPRGIHRGAGACRETKAIDTWEKKSAKPRRDERVTVFAQTLAWLKHMQKTTDRL